MLGFSQSPRAYADLGGAAARTPIESESLSEDQTIARSACPFRDDRDPGRGGTSGTSDYGTKSSDVRAKVSDYGPEDDQTSGRTGNDNAKCSRSREAGGGADAGDGRHHHQWRMPRGDAGGELQADDHTRGV